MRFCSSCGAQLSPQTKFCSSCGAAVAASAAPHDTAEQPTQAVPGHTPHTGSASRTGSGSNDDEATRAVPSSFGDQETRAVPASDGSSSFTSSSPASSSSTSAASPYASSGYGSASPYESSPFQSSPQGSSSYGSSGSSSAGHDSSGYGSGYGSAGGYESASQRPAPVPPAPAELSDGKRSGGSSVAKIAAAAVAVVALAGGAAFAYSSMKGDDSPASAPAVSNSASAGATGGAAAPSGTADAKPKTMPDLKGKSIDEAQALLSSSVKIETAKTNLKEGMNGGAVISAQETAAGQPTPDTVKVTLDQPANVTYVNEDNSLVVESNPFSTSEGQVANHTYKQYDTVSMSGYDKDSPKELKLNLNRAYSRLRTEVAIDSKANDQDKVFTVTIKKDNSQIWREQIKFGDAPKAIDLDVKDALRVQIQVAISGGTEDNQSKDSQLDFGDLRVLAEPGKGNSSSSSSS